MHKPLKLIVIIIPGSEYPVPVAFFVLDAVIIPVPSFLNPPLLLYALRALSLDDLIDLTFVSEQHGWIIRNGCRDLDSLRGSQQLQRPDFVRSPGSRYFLLQCGSAFERPLRPVMFIRYIPLNGFHSDLTRKPIN